MQAALSESGMPLPLLDGMLPAVTRLLQAHKASTAQARALHETVSGSLVPSQLPSLSLEVAY